MKSSKLLLIMLGFASSAAFSQSTQPSATGDAPAPDTVSGIEVKTENGFTYACGGVGESEEADMKSRAGDYDMMLTFATRKGEYLADVNVEIENAKGGAHLQAMCGGPIMLVNVPQSGTFRIHAETGGYTLNKTARVNTRRNRPDALVMHWPTPIGESLEQTSTGSSGAPADAQSGTSGAAPNPDQPRSEPPAGMPDNPAAGTQAPSQPIEPRR